MGCSKMEGGVWGGVVVFSAFMIQVLAFGTAQTIGIYNVEFLDYFDTGAAAVSLVGSINLGVFLGAGPLTSVLMSRYSHRQVCLLGAVLTSIGLVVLPFTPNLVYLYVFYGVLTGLGNCFVYVPSHVLCGLYYHKHRSLATGVATAGSGIGATIFPFIVYVIIDHYGWKGSMFILAGLNLHLLIFAALLRPPPEGTLCAADGKERVPEVELSLLHKNNSNDTLDTALMENGENGVAKEKPKDILKGANIHSDAVADGNLLADTDEMTKLQELMEDTSAQVATVSPDPPVVDLQRRKSVAQRLQTHFRALFHFSYTIFVLNNIFWNAGFGILMIFLAEYLISIGFTKEDASLVFTVIGAGVGVGCIAGGSLGNIRCFDRILLYIAGNLGAGSLTILFLWSALHTLPVLCVIAAMYGFMIGIILGLMVVVTADLLGVDLLGDGFGYLMFANGLGLFGGPPIAGVIVDMTGDLSHGMLLAGVVTVVGGVLMCVVPLRRQQTRSGGYRATETQINIL